MKMIIRQAVESKLYRIEEQLEATQVLLQERVDELHQAEVRVEYAREALSTLHKSIRSHVVAIDDLKAFLAGDAS